MDRPAKDLDTLRASDPLARGEVGVSAGRFVKLAIAAAFVIVTLHVVRAVMFFGLEINRFGFLFGRFDLNGEGVIPSWFSSLLLASCAVVALAIALMKAAVRDRYRLHWLLMSLLLIYLSADEGAEIHELWRHYLDPDGDWTGVLYYPSALPNVIGATLIGLFMLPFAFSLGRETLLRLILAGSLYVGGAVGVEVVSGLHELAAGRTNLGYQLLVALEEGLEMAGVLVLLSTLLDYLRKWTDRPRLALRA